MRFSGFVVRISKKVRNMVRIIIRVDVWIAGRIKANNKTSALIQYMV